MFTRLNAKGTRTASALISHSTVSDVHWTGTWDQYTPSLAQNFGNVLEHPLLTKAPKLRAYGSLKLKPKGLTDVTVEVLGRQKFCPL